MDKTCDVIIPTYNSEAVIAASLTSLCGQAVPAGWKVRVIVSNDGSTDNTITQAKKALGVTKWKYEIISDTHAGAAAARNRAIARSRAEIIFMLGADILLKPGALSDHLNFHLDHPRSEIAALGIVRWDPLIKPSCLMEWMTHGGSQNDFDAILGAVTVNPSSFFYGSHLSLRRVVLRDNLFAEDFQHYGWEDLDLGRRLANQAGLKLYLLPEAIGYHRHYYNAQDIFMRQRAMGLGWRAWQQHQPDQLTTTKTRQYGHRLKYATIKRTGLLAGASLLIRLGQNKISTPRLYKFAADSYFWAGFHQLYPHNN